VRIQNDVNESKRNDLSVNTGMTRLADSTMSQTPKSYSTSAAKLLLEQMEKLKLSKPTPENTLAMVACARAIADLIRANAETKRL